MKAKNKEIIIRDTRVKEKFVVDDIYLNGYARILKPSVTVVYLSLCRHVNTGQEAFPTQELIAAEHDIAPRTVRRAISILRKAHILAVSKTRRDSGTFLRNVYVLLDKSQWVPREELKAMIREIKQKLLKI